MLDAIGLRVGDHVARCGDLEIMELGDMDIYVCIYVYINMCIYIYVYIYTHTYIRICMRVNMSYLYT